jgi:hypothetical protein
MQTLSKELEKDAEFKTKINSIGEALIDLKETLKSKIQHQISIYKNLA